MDHNEDDTAPLALRRTRRSNFGVRIKDEPESVPEVKTPRRRKRTRFSDPGPLTSTGLTPMIRRTALRTPSSSHRRASAPTPSRAGAHPALCTKSNGHADPAQPLRTVTDGRVERRLRRTALRTALDKLDTAHRRSSDRAQSLICRLRSELRTRDREIYELQNATIVVDTGRIWDLEQQVEDLQRELGEAQQQQQPEPSYEWTMAARDPFERHRYSDTNMDLAYDGEDEDVFGETTMAQLACSTPSRARASFPTPPATSPLAAVPETPSMNRSRVFQCVPTTPTTVSHASVQAVLPDPLMQVELESLRRETTRLTTTLDSYKSLVDRLAARLPDTSSPNDEEVLEINAAHTRDAVEREVEGVLQTLSDRTAAMEMLNSSIAGLGFPGSDSAEMLTALASAFRAARLELEYLTPGEITLPLTSHGAEVLDLLLERLRELARKVKEGDDAVDEYHAIELNLRQQLDARVSAMDSLQADLAKAQTAAGGKDGKIRELEVANDRLRGAVDGYIRDIAELERLVESIEADAGTKDAAMTDLEARLTAAEQRAADLKDELEVAQASRKKHVASVNRRSGEALALRDARVAELRGEIDRVNGALRDAYETIRGLRVEGGRAEEQNRELVGVVEGMKGELQRVLRMSEGVMAGVGSAEEGDGGDVGHEADVDVAAKPRKLFSGKLARRISGMSKRDSGLGLLDEDEIDV